MAVPRLYVWSCLRLLGAGSLTRAGRCWRIPWLSDVCCWLEFALVYVLLCAEVLSRLVVIRRLGRLVLLAVRLVQFGAGGSAWAACLCVRLAGSCWLVLAVRLEVWLPRAF